jgi:hypothetical protein
MEDIKVWLASENRDYTEGVGLFSKHGRNRTLLKTLQFKESDFNNQKLIYELSKLASSNLIVIETKPVIAFGNGAKVIAENPLNPSPRGENIENLVISSFPRELEDMIVLRGHLTNKKAIVHNSMHNLEATDKETRQVKMEEMAAIRAQIMVIDETEYYFKKHGKMPDVVDVEPDKLSDLDAPLPSDPVALLKLQKSLRERKSKANAKLKPIPEKHPDRIPIENKITKIDARLKEIEKHLT